MPRAPFRVGFRLVLPKLFHQSYCEEVLGFSGGGKRREPLPDREGHFAAARQLVSDGRLRPRVVGEGGDMDFGQVKKGDTVRVVVCLEPYRTSAADTLGIELVLKRIQVQARKQTGVAKRMKLGAFEDIFDVDVSK